MEGNCSPGSRWLYRLGVSQAQKTSGDEDKIRKTVYLSLIVVQMGGIHDFLLFSLLIMVGEGFGTPAIHDIAKLPKTATPDFLK